MTKYQEIDKRLRERESEVANAPGSEDLILIRCSCDRKSGEASASVSNATYAEALTLMAQLVNFISLEYKVDKEVVLDNLTAVHDILGEYYKDETTVIKEKPLTGGLN